MQTLAQLKSGALKGISTVKISEGLTEFPLEILDLADTLTHLDLSSNQLKTLPETFNKLSNLKVLFASNNLFDHLPEVLGECPALEIIGFKANQIETVSPLSIQPNLKWLILTDNKIKALPDGIGQCLKLQKLMLAGNQLSRLPEAMAKCQSLALLRISANRLNEIPQWLIDMPSLSWLAFSGNQIKLHRILSTPKSVSEDVIHLKELLGEGASGTIFKATLSGLSTSSAEVAVKVFKGAVTSDGYPADEMNAYIGAGEHPVIVKLLGQIEFKKEDKSGVVMDLIPDDFYNLGRPPSLDTCTRDVFIEGQKLSLKQVLKIAASIASVGLHLHQRGIMHGDVYAHNILVNQSGETLFGDFGAASFYDRHSPIADQLEKIEVKAYGFLLEDLLTLCRDQDSPRRDVLISLKDHCLSDVQAYRPSFNEIVEQLNQL